MWYARDPRHGGKHKSTGETDEKRAATVLAAWKLEALTGHSAPLPPPPTPTRQQQLQAAADYPTMLSEVFDAFVESKIRNRSVAKYRMQLDRMLDVLGEQRAAAVTRRAVQRGLDSLADERNGRPVSAATWNRYRAALQAAFRLAVLDEKVPRDPVAGVQRQKETPRRQEAKPEQLETLLTEAPDDELRRLIIAGVETGLRMNEIIHCRFEPDEEVGVVPAWVSKTGEERDVGLTAKAREAMTPGWTKKAATYSSAFRRLKIRLGYDLRFHDLRRTFGNARAREGADPAALQAQLGHSSPLTTLRIYRSVGHADLRRLVRGGAPEASRLESLA